jgi:hypothetical protein
MSTDHQQYSTLNQSDKIQEYADKNNIKLSKPMLMMEKVD